MTSLASKGLLIVVIWPRYWFPLSFRLQSRHYPPCLRYSSIYSTDKSSGSDVSLTHVSHQDCGQRISVGFAKSQEDTSETSSRKQLLSGNNKLKTMLIWGTTPQPIVTAVGMQNMALYLACDFPISMKNGILWTKRQAADLYVIDYESANHFVLKMLNIIKAVPGKRKDRTPKVDSEKNSPELHHVVKSDLCYKQLYTWNDFWKLVHELPVMWHVSWLGSIDIRV